MRRFLLLLMTAAAVLAAVAGSATASPPGTQHLLITHHWGPAYIPPFGDTYIGGLRSCNLFGSVDPWALFHDVDLTDHINSTISDASNGNGLMLFDSVATLHGVINTPDGSYTVAGQFNEYRVDWLAPWYFDGSGRATISGPHGVVSGEAEFLDLTEWPPLEFAVHFTDLTVCNLK